MSWFRRRPVAPSVRVESEEDRIARRVREMRDAEGEPLDPSDAFPGSRTDAAPEPAPAPPCSPSHCGGSHHGERGGLDFDVSGPDHVVTCGCGRVVPCRHCT